jgi:hypothetical protein
LSCSREYAEKELTAAPVCLVKPAMVKGSGEVGVCSVAWEKENSEGCDMVLAHRDDRLADLYYSKGDSREKAYVVNIRWV